ncbi:MAG TPA: CARDB domain-containing protein, partial [Candidatus Thermoplasmatota archaeon]|nr:CARDB domain-containing protein [Candidatus Thermoplasmatota archaeon]
EDREGAAGTINAMLLTPLINITGMGAPRLIFAQMFNFATATGDVYARLANANGEDFWPPQRNSNLCGKAPTAEDLIINPDTEPNGWVPLTGWDFAPVFAGKSVNYDARKWVTGNVGVKEAMELAGLGDLPDGQDTLDDWPYIQFCWRADQVNGIQKTQGSSTAEEPGLMREWSIDDVLVTPFTMDLGPSQRVPIVDNVTKEYRFLLRNLGGYTDTYRVALQDETGLPSKGPGFWSTEVLDESGAPLREIQMGPGDQRVISLRLHVGVAPPTAAHEGTVDLALSVLSKTASVLRSTQHLFLDFAYPERPNARIVGLIVNDATLSIDKPRTVDVLVQNTGTTAMEDVELMVVDKMDPSFGVAPEDLRRLDGSAVPAFDLAPGELRVITVNWIPRVAGEHNLTAIADPANRVLEFDEIDNTFVKPIEIPAAQFPDLVVDVAVSKENPIPGDAVEVTVTIRNVGGATAEGVQLSVRAGVTDLLPGESPHVLPRAIPPGATEIVNATWRPAFPGEQTIIVRAKTLAGVLERLDTSGDNVQVLAIQVRSRGLELVGPGTVQVAAGGTATAQIEVKNRGDLDDTYRVRLTPPDGWRAELRGYGEVAHVAVANHSSANLTLVFGPPSLAEAGPYELLVQAESEHGTDAAQTSVVAVIPQEFGVRFLVDHEVLLQPGKRALPIQLQNGGNGADLVTVRARSAPAGWQVEPTTFPLRALQRLEGAINVSIPTTTPEGAYALVLEAQGKGGALLAQDVLVQVLPLELVTLRLEGVPALVAPGQELQALLRVANEGNQPARAAIAFTAPSGWVARLERDVASMLPGETRALGLTLVVPANASAAAQRLDASATSGRGLAYALQQTVRVAHADLELTEAELLPRGQVREGAVSNVQAKVVNRGELPALASLAVYVDDELVAFEPGEELAPGGEAKVQGSFRAVAGEHVVLVVADPGKQVGEEDEANNARLLVQHVERPAGVFAVPGPEPWLLVLAVAGVAVLMGRRVRR